MNRYKNESHIMTNSCAYMRDAAGGLYLKDFQNDITYRLAVDKYTDKHSAHPVPTTEINILYQVSPKVKAMTWPLLTHPEGVYKLIRPILGEGDDDLLYDTSAYGYEYKPTPADEWAENYVIPSRGWCIPVPDDEVEDLLMHTSIECRLVDKEMLDEGY